ncbi:hypothetical protein [Vibrio sp. MA40-2]|uniref:hypothetical protein n=1 Tax=Vibrio sp. MA40-2 TaxID=3391828 RepID=UPI0039A622EE
MDTFAINKQVKLQVDAFGVKDASRIRVNIRITLLDEKQQKLAIKIDRAIIKNQGVTYPFITEDIANSFNINPSKVAYVKGWIDLNGDGVLDYNEEVTIRIMPQELLFELVEVDYSNKSNQGQYWPTPTKEQLERAKNITLAIQESPKNIGKAWDEMYHWIYNWTNYTSQFDSNLAMAVTDVIIGANRVFSLMRDRDIELTELQRICVTLSCEVYKIKNSDVNKLQIGSYLLKQVIEQEYKYPVINTIESNLEYPKAYLQKTGEIINVPLIIGGRFENGNGDIIIAFVGTDPSSSKDWAENLKQGISWLESPRYKIAMEKAHELIEEIDVNQITFTGHSLGGGLATAAAKRIGGKAYVFNAAGVRDETVPEQKPADITTFYSTWDMLQMSNRSVFPNANGKQVSLGAIGSHGMKVICDKYGIKGHNHDK